MSTVLGGVLCGAGRQTLGAVISGVVAYCLGLPVQVTLGFLFTLGVVGMWWGAALASTVQAVVEVRPLEHHAVGLKSISHCQQRAIASSLGQRKLPTISSVYELPKSQEKAIAVHGHTLRLQAPYMDCVLQLPCQDGVSAYVRMLFSQENTFQKMGGV